jgi:hypothetical protein
MMGQNTVKPEQKVEQLKRGLALRSGVRGEILRGDGHKCIREGMAQRDDPISMDGQTFNGRLALAPVWC